MAGFAQVERRHREMAIDMIEDAKAGRAFAQDVPLATGAATRAMSMAPNANDAHIAAATQTALQEQWEASYNAGDIAVRMAGLISIQAEASTRARHDRGIDTSAEAIGSFASLPHTRQEEIASALNRSTVISARDASHAVEDAAAAAKLGRTLPRDVPRDRFETLRRELDRARQQLGIGADEWREPGERGRVSMLLHVQAPAMIAAAGGRPRADHANAEAIAAQTLVLSERPTQAVEGPGGVKSNLILARQLAGWLAPMIDSEVRAMVSRDGGIEMLASEFQVSRSRGIGRASMNQVEIAA